MTPADRSRRKFPLQLDRLDGKAMLAARPPVRAHRDAASAERQSQAGMTAAPLQAAQAGADLPDLRRHMGERLREGGIAHPHLLAAFAKVPRHVFVDPALAGQAYEDTSLPIGLGQTISKPSVVARMLELLLGGANASRRGTLGAALEIGTGCGYQAALLCELAQRIVSVERLRPLYDKAQATLAPMRGTRLRLVYGDGMLGHPPGAPYDAIVAAAGGDDIPEAWLQQLAIGGRLVSPVNRGRDEQVLVIVDRHEHGWERHVREAVRFVPLKSGIAG